MKRPLFVVGIVFALGEVICRFCMDTEYIEAAVIGSVILPVLLYFVCKTVLQGRTVFLLVTGSFLLGVMWGWIIFQVKKPLDVGTHLSGSFVISRLSESGDGYSMELICGNERYYAYVSYEEMSGWQYDADRNNKSSEKNEQDVSGEYDSWGDGDSTERYKGMLRVGQGYLFTGEVKELSGPTNPGQFDHKQYLLGRGIRRQLDIESMKRCRKYDSKLRILLDKCRESLAGVIRGLMPERYSGVLSAMLFGDKSGLEDDMRKLFQVNGIAHILAISSLHMAFFASIIAGLLRLIGVRRRLRAILTIAGLFLYGLMTGFSDATIRAFIMISAVLLAEVFGRTPDKPTAMVTALLVMLMINPDCILSASFQMSYAAAGGLIFSEMIYKAIYENERFKGVNRRIRKRYKLFVMGLISSVSLNVCMVPLVAGGYYEVPLYSMAVNFIIIPLLFFAVAFGFAAAVTGLIGVVLPEVGNSLSAIGNIMSAVGSFMRNLAKILAFPSEMILRFYEWVCRLFMRLPMARINCGRVKVWEYIVYGVLLAGIVLYFSRGNTSKIKRKQRNRVRETVSRIINYLPASVIEQTRRKNKSDSENGRILHDTCTVRKLGLSDWESVVSYETTRKREIRRCVGYIASCVLLEAGLIIGTIFINRSGSYSVMLDVGQGNASFVHTSGGANIIYDCGSSSKNDVGKNILVPALKYYSMSDIDVVFLSHSDSDHINGLIYLFENYDMEGISVDMLCLAEGIPEDDDLDRLIAAAKRAGCKVVYVSAGDTIRVGEARMEVVYPYEEDDSDTGEGGLSTERPDHREERNSIRDRTDIREERNSIRDRTDIREEREIRDKNDYSLVIRLVYDDTRILFTGDISAEVEQVIIERYGDGYEEGDAAYGINGNEGDMDYGITANEGDMDYGNISNNNGRSDGCIDSDILVCPHHGSKYSSSEQLIDAVSPETVVISCGKNNLYGHPASETLERYEDAGVRIRRTDKEGAIIIKYD